MRCKVCIFLFALAFAAIAIVPAQAADVGFYFDSANELIDLPNPGTEFYGEVTLTLSSLNNLLIEVNAFTSPGENDSQGNYISSPLVPGDNFGIDKFGANSTLIASEADFNTFTSFYDIILPGQWSCSWGGVAGEMGKFEFWNTGTGGSRQDPLTVQITPKSGAIIPTALQIDSVFDFIELCPQGTYFAMHAGGFTCDSSYWESGSLNPESSFFAVTVIPEPGTVLLVLLGFGILLRKVK